MHPLTRLQLCPDPRRREELLDIDPDDAPAGAITPVILPVAPSSNSNLDLVDLEALAKKTGRNPVDLSDLVARRTLPMAVSCPSR